MAGQGNGWNEWRRQVFYRLERNEADHRAIIDEIRKIDDRIREHDVQIALLQLKAGAWGAVAALVTFLAVAAARNFF